ncbi:hypothetical protein H5410_049931 [Solanum commersonii]|uniref:Uncharacterized protein n=1 Tax=Solanum commersonii TaxID=4109 RepID=A0A9J5WWE8_SOLCO|nr:hypothetical protein H5410_049931 [Solanum commersonii]
MEYYLFGDNESKTSELRTTLPPREPEHEQQTWNLNRNPSKFSIPKNMRRRLEKCGRWAAFRLLAFGHRSGVHASGVIEMGWARLNWKTRGENGLGVGELLDWRSWNWENGLGSLID